MLASALVILLPGTLLPSSLPPTDRPPRIEPAALTLLAHSARATLALRTYQAECRTVLTGTDSKAAPQRQFATLRAAKPNLMRYERWDLAGGSTTWARPAAPPRYVYACAGDRWYQQFGTILRDDNRPSPENLSTILEPWRGFYDLADSPFREAQDALKRDPSLEVKLDGTERVEGVSCRRVALITRSDYNGQAVRNAETWSIGPDGLVRRLVSRYAFGDDPETVTDAVLVKISKNAPILPATYAYTPPPGVKRRSNADLPALLTAGTLAPDFEATDAEGQVVRLADLRGKVVVVDFWATWCAPCMASLPHAQSVVARLQAEGLPVVFLGVDDAETRAAYLRVAREAPKTYPNLRLVHIAKAGSVSSLYRVSSIPTQYVVGTDGVVNVSSVGYAGPTDDLERAVRAVIARAR